MAESGEQSGPLVLAALPNDHNVREVGKRAVWTVTSAKPGNGVELLRDGRDDTYWQSDGTQPHLVDIQFHKKVALSYLAIQLDYKLDESYTPNRLSVRAGTSFLDLKEVKTVDLEEPTGWVIVRLPKKYLKAYFVQLAIISNHQNGRDTHIRQVKIFGPRQERNRGPGREVDFVTVEFMQYATVR